MPPVEARVVAAISDCGVDLDAFARVTGPLPPVRTSLAIRDDGSEFRRLERLLRSGRTDAAHSPLPSPRELVPRGEPGTIVNEGGDAAPTITPTYRRATKSPPGASLLLLTGATSLLTGMFLLIAANMLIHPAAWRWGFAAAIGGQGVLLAVVAMMAIRLWRNSRWMNQQLEAVDRRLHEVQSALTQPPEELGASSLRSALRRFDRPADLSLALQ